MGGPSCAKPAVFLFDEPLSNLDAKLRGQMRAELSRLHKRLETTMIYVTHDQVEAMTMGTMIVIMKDGLVQQVASPMEIYEYPANLFVAGFIGNPGMNFMPAEIAESEEGLVIRSDGYSLEVPEPKRPFLKKWLGEKVTLGIRPEHMEDMAFANPDDFKGSMTARLDVVETLGAEIQLNVVVGGSTLVARVDPRSRGKVDDTMELAVNLDRIHLFANDGEQMRITTEKRH